MDQLVKMVELNFLRSRPLVNPYHHKYAYIERGRERRAGGRRGGERARESETKRARKRFVSSPIEV
jgi:hypothetical protein